MPDPLDFLRHGLTLHNLSCEAALIADSLARSMGASLADSLLMRDLSERFRCL